MYRCPGRGCGREYKLLSSLIQHVESESCGFIRFEKVQAAQRQLTEVMSGRRRMITGVF